MYADECNRSYDRAIERMHTRKNCRSSQRALKQENMANYSHAVPQLPALVRCAIWIAFLFVVVVVALFLNDGEYSMNRFLFALKHICRRISLYDRILTYLTVWNLPGSIVCAPGLWWTSCIVSRLEYLLTTLLFPTESKKPHCFVY